MMGNKEKYDGAFMESFSIPIESLNDGLAYQSIRDWDSIGHLGLIAELEDVFDISLETDDIIDFSSYEKGREILAKYGVRV